MGVVRSGHIIDVILKVRAGNLDVECESAGRKQKFEYIYRKLPITF